MKFTSLIKTLKILFSAKQLPGIAAHNLMCPTYAKYLKPSIELQKAAVMILFYPKDDQAFFVLIKRTSTENGPHSGQISLPGGRFDPLIDNNLQETALREINEEIGIPVDEIKIIGNLTEIVVPVSSHIVSPFVGAINNILPWKINLSEVDYIIEVPLSTLFNNEMICTDTIVWNNNTHYIPYYNINGEKVWGATAMILSELKVLLQSAN